MNWISNVVRPKIRNFLARRETPENLWIKCPETGQLVFYKDVEANQFVIPGSNYHMRMSATARLKSIFDGETWFDIAVPDVPLDPLKFRDERRYADRLKDARSKTGTNDAIKLGYGKLDGLPVVISGAGLRLHGRLARHGGGRGGDQGTRNGGREEHALHHVRGLRRRAHAGGNPLADAASAHHGGGADAARGEEALHRRAHQSDHRRRHRLLRHARRRADRGAGRAHRLRRSARDRADHPREAAGRRSSARNICKEHGMVDMVVHRHQLRATLSNLCRLLSKAPRQARRRRRRPSRRPSRPCRRRQARDDPAASRLHHPGLGAVRADADRRAASKAGSYRASLPRAIRSRSPTPRLYLPTRRACRLARDLFLEVTRERAAILPRIVPIGDLDEDEIVFAQAASAGCARSRCRRRSAGSSGGLLLAQLVLTWANRIEPQRAARRRWSPAIPPPRSRSPTISRA